MPRVHPDVRALTVLPTFALPPIFGRGEASLPIRTCWSGLSHPRLSCVPVKQLMVSEFISAVNYWPSGWLEFSFFLF